MSYEGEHGERNARRVGASEAGRIEFATGTVAHLVAPGSVTEGRYGLFRWEMPPRAAGADPHFHRTFSEAFYVLSGRVTLFDGARWTEARDDDFLLVPEGGIHGFRNESDEPASMLILFAPGAARERYFEELAGLGRSGRTLSPEERRAFLARHDQYAVEAG